ncbi:3-hydroxyacyl-CoA dehydrogenase family protein [Miltoncostaea marina]|uniref:3-hydroxyacyl-CoA dehydrogenase family protein n=1 Tax=Miltoncostaea marina TaxID=2843215 RepID=UPI001C3E5892|nr:3-hydroxyacyl-CoA dehydrogenase family protein [Miltoncostaea marina]
MPATPSPPRATVLGTGAMGPEIAAALAAAGHRVVIAGRDAGRALAARDRALALLGRDGPVSDAPIGPDALAGAALVVETIVEDLAAKRELLARAEAWCPPDAVIATNTSSLRIGDLAAALARPERFAGLHFLKPAHQTAVVEIVPGPATDAAVVAALREVAGRMGKAPLVVRADVPGFIWNRIQFAVLRECLHMLEAGVADAADIDAAVSDGLAPRWMAAGPLATADLGGLRTFAAVAAQLFPELSAARAPQGALLDRAAGGDVFAPWTGAAGEEVARLRARALEMGREVAARRRKLGA